MKRKYWNTLEFEKEFLNIEDSIVPSIFKLQIDKIRSYINHWKECRDCRLGFDLSNYGMTFEKLFIKLAASPPQLHICDGTYEYAIHKQFCVVHTNDIPKFLNPL